MSSAENFESGEVARVIPGARQSTQESHQTEGYFMHKATVIHDQISRQTSDEKPYLTQEERNTLQKLVDGYNETCPFMYRPVYIDSSFHAVTNRDSIWDQEGVAIPQAGSCEGVFLEFCLGSIKYQDTEITYGLIAKTAVEIDEDDGEWIFFYTPLTVGTVVPLLP